MSNSLITIAQVTRSFQRYLHNNLGFLKSVNREYSKEFAVKGAKIGATCNVRNPFRSITGQGAVINPQGVSESTTPITVNRQWNTSLAFTSAERSLSIDDYEKRYIAPAAAKLASDMDLDCLVAAITGSYKFTNPSSGVSCPGAGPIFNCVGTPGTTPGTSGGSAAGIARYNAPTIYLNSMRMLRNMACPMDGNLHLGVDTAAEAESINAAAGLFNPQGIISTQYRKGQLGAAFGYDSIYSDQNLPSIITGTRAATSNATVSTTGWNVAGYTVSGTTGLTLAAGTGTVKAGEIFTIEGVYSVNPENQQSTGILQQFVVIEDVTLSGASNPLKFSPSVKVSGSGISDANVTVTAVGGTQAISFLGAASTVFANSLGYHSDAFTLATVDMDLPGGTDMADRQVHDGVSLRIVKDYDIVTDQQICRIDVLGGFSVLRPELAVRIAG